MWTKWSGFYLICDSSSVYDENYTVSEIQTIYVICDLINYYKFSFIQCILEEKRYLPSHQELFGHSILLIIIIKLSIIAILGINV